MVVVPIPKEEQNEDNGGEHSICRQRNRRNGRRIRRNGVYVKDNPTRREKRQDGPSDESPVRPLRRRGHGSRNKRLLDSLRRPAADNQIRAVASYDHAVQSSARIYVRDSFLVGERKLLEIGAVALWAA